MYSFNHSNLFFSIRLSLKVPLKAQMNMANKHFNYYLEKKNLEKYIVMERL